MDKLMTQATYVYMHFAMYLFSQNKVYISLNHYSRSLKIYYLNHMLCFKWNNTGVYTKTYVVAHFAMESLYWSLHINFTLSSIR